MLCLNVAQGIFHLSGCLSEYFFEEKPLTKRIFSEPRLQKLFLGLLRRYGQNKIFNLPIP